ncbi:hypothetical protein FEP90_02211 [Burkholderia multivorans]|nr:hypothetical protein [Burkholderia multivorans]
MAKLLQIFRFLRGVDVPAQLAERRGEHEQRDQLRRERLRRRDADLGARVREELHAGQAHHRARCDVADRERVRVAERLRVLERGERVGRFAGLRDHQHELARVRHRVAIAVFARNLDLRRDLRDRLEPVLRGQPRVVARAAREDQQAVDLRERGGRGVAEQRRVERVRLRHRVADRARLLEDFLLHEVAIRAEFDRAAVGADHADLALRERAVAIDDLHAVERQLADVAFLEEREAVGAARQRERVGREEVLAVAVADDERRTLARTDDGVRLVLVDHRDRVRAVQLLHRCAHGVEQVAAIQAVHEVRDHFGVGLRHEFVALRAQRVAQRLEVLDDAVVHERQRARREDRMRVVRDGRAVRRPARVRDARRALEVRFANLRVEIGDARDAARALGRIRFEHGDAARIVATVFEAPQSFDQHRNDITLRNCADNAAHEWSIL